MMITAVAQRSFGVRFLRGLNLTLSWRSHNRLHARKPDPVRAAQAPGDPNAVLRRPFADTVIQYSSVVNVSAPTSSA
jgi:hypothetical protein